MARKYSGTRTKSILETTNLNENIMATNLKKLNDGRIVLSNAAYLHVTPWKNEDEIDLATSYDIVNIVGDTLSFTPDDNTVNEKEWEFGDTPLFENITLGKIQFGATCIDFQNAILKTLFGWKTDEAGNSFAPSSYKDLFITLEVGFKNEDVVVVVPKLKLNAKAVISTMKTGTSEGNLAGTCYNANVAVGAKAPTSVEMKTKLHESPMAILKKPSGDSSFYYVEQKSKGDGETNRQFGKFHYGLGVDSALESPAS